MGLFSDLKSEGLETQGDRLGGFAALETDAYEGKIKLAYAGKSTGGAQFVELVVDIGAGKEYKETIYVTNKNGENWFLNKNDKTKKVSLPGFTTMNDICMMTTEKELSEQDTEEKVVKIYDYDQKKDVPTNAHVLVELLGKDICLGIIKQIEDKSKKDGAGNYVPTGDTRETNVIDKVFHSPTHLTMTEALAGNTEAAFYASWVERHKGVTKDRSSGAAGKAGAPGRAVSNAAAPAASEVGGGRKSLFGK